jgi:hypothetical protein
VNRYAGVGLKARWPKQGACSLKNEFFQPVAVDIRKGITIEFRIADLRLLIVEPRKSAINNRKSSFKADCNRDWLFTGTVLQGMTELKE